MIEFTVHGQPQPAGSKRAFQHRTTGRVVVVDDAKGSRPWKEDVARAASIAMGAKSPLEGPLMVGMEFYVTRPQSHYGARGLRPSAPEIPIVKPDLLKLARAVEDALTGIVYRDDVQIAREILDKFYGDPARVEIRVRPLNKTNSEATR